MRVYLCLRSVGWFLLLRSSFFGLWFIFAGCLNISSRACFLFGNFCDRTLGKWLISAIFPLVSCYPAKTCSEERGSIQKFRICSRIRFTLILFFDCCEFRSVQEYRRENFVSLQYHRFECSLEYSTRFPLNLGIQRNLKLFKVNYLLQQMHFVTTGSLFISKDIATNIILRPL